MVRRDGAEAVLEGRVLEGAPLTPRLPPLLSSKLFVPFYCAHYDSCENMRPMLHAPRFFIQELVPCNNKLECSVVAAEEEDRSKTFEASLSKSFSILALLNNKDGCSLQLSSVIAMLWRSLVRDAPLDVQTAMDFSSCPDLQHVWPMITQHHKWAIKQLNIPDLLESLQNATHLKSAKLQLCLLENALTCIMAFEGGDLTNLFTGSLWWSALGRHIRVVPQMTAERQVYSHVISVLSLVCQVCHVRAL